MHIRPISRPLEYTDLMSDDPVFHDGDEDYERAKIIAASQSGGSAKAVRPEQPGTARFGDAVFGEAVHGGEPAPNLGSASGHLTAVPDCDWPDLRDARADS